MMQGQKNIKLHLTSKTPFFSKILPGKM